MTTDIDKLAQQMREAAEKATPGPWVVQQTVIHGRSYGGSWIERESGDIRLTGSGGAMSWTNRVVDVQRHDDNDINARFIALANPVNIVALLDDRDRLREALAAKEQECERLASLVREAAGIIGTEFGCLAESHSVGGELRLDLDDEGDRTAGEVLAEMNAWLKRAALATSGGGNG